MAWYTAIGGLRGAHPAATCPRGAITGYEGAGSYDLADFTAAPGNADFGDFGGLDGGPGPMDDGGDGEPPTD